MAGEDMVACVGHWPGTRRELLLGLACVENLLRG